MVNEECESTFVELRKVIHLGGWRIRVLLLDHRRELDNRVVFGYGGARLGDVVRILPGQEVGIDGWALWYFHDGTDLVAVHSKTSVPVVCWG